MKKKISTQECIKHTELSYLSALVEMRGRFVVYPKRGIVLSLTFPFEETAKKCSFIIEKYILHTPKVSLKNTRWYIQLNGARVSELLDLLDPYIIKEKYEEFCMMEKKRELLAQKEQKITERGKILFEKFYSLLPIHEEFTRKDCHKIRKQLDISARTLDFYLKKLVKEGTLQRTGHGKYFNAEAFEKIPEFVVIEKEHIPDLLLDDSISQIIRIKSAYTDNIAGKKYYNSVEELIKDRGTNHINGCYVATKQWLIK